jgi:hypothetical protein
MSSRSTRFMNEPLALERALQRLIIRLSTSCLIKSYEGDQFRESMMKNRQKPAAGFNPLYDRSQSRDF